MLTQASLQQRQIAARIAALRVAHARVATGMTAQMQMIPVNGMPGIPVDPTAELVQRDLDDDEDGADGDGDNEVNGVENGVKPPPGCTLEIKRLDEVYVKATGEYKIRESAKTKGSKANKIGKYAHYAFTVVRKFTPKDQTRDIITTTLDIQSPYLRKVGAAVIKNYLGTSWNAKPLKVDPKVFLTYLPHVQDYVQDLRNKDSPSEDKALTIEHTQFLIDFIKSDHAAALEEIHSLVSNGEITFDLLWAILIPSTILYVPCPVTNEPRATRLVRADLCVRQDGSRYWAIEAEYVEWNHDVGPTFGLATLPGLEISQFTGAKKIASLPVYPMKWHHEQDHIREKMIQRGKKWVQHAGVHHMHYDATAYFMREGKLIKMNTKSRVMLDWKTFAQVDPNYLLPNVTKTLSRGDIDKHSHVYDRSTPKEAMELSDDDLFLASPIVYGFSLSDKMWVEFNVKHVQPFEWNEESFENLVLPHAQKSLIKSLVEAHGGHGLEHFDDFVEGKGKGLVINLFGNPGVGKSLTAEATSEHVRKPLYVVGAGDLGTSAAILDQKLTRIFNISSNWGAVVLIDEADVFLEERSLHNLERNAMVAVFLRQLEYFRGILFLTTNRVRTFDEAFQSRIHVALRYHDLSSDAKRQIWAAFLKKTTAGSIERDSSLPVIQNLSSEQIRELGERKVNGRQIKNVVRTASVLATSKNEQVGYNHLIQVLDMMEQFESSNAMYQ